MAAGGRADTGLRRAAVVGPDHRSASVVSAAAVLLAMALWLGAGPSVVRARAGRPPRAHRPHQGLLLGRTDVADPLAVAASAGPARYLYPAVTLKRFGASRISFVLPAGGAHPLPDGLRTPPSRSAAALRTNWGRAFACSARVRHWAGSSTTPPPTKLTITRCSQTRCPRRLRTPPVPSGRTDGRWLGCPRCGG